MTPEVEASVAGHMYRGGKPATQRGEFWPQKSGVGTGEITMDEAKLPREEMVGGPSRPCPPNCPLTLRPFPPVAAAPKGRPGVSHLGCHLHLLSVADSYFVRALLLASQSW